MDVTDGVHAPVGDEHKSLRETIIKTATYVNQNGTNFEDRLKNDAKFSFVNPEDEYYGYYQYILHSNGAQNCQPREPYSFSFMSYDKNLSPRDLEIIKTAAAFCVANEDTDYLGKLREQFVEDPLFSFLKTDHSLNGTFIQFMNQYKQVKSNTHGPPTFEYKNEDYKNIILRRSFQRAEYYEYAKELENEKKQVAYLRKVQFAAFDWTKFTVVNKVELSDTDKEPLDLAELSLKKIDTTKELELFDEGKSRTEGETKSRKRKVRAAGETRLKRSKTGTKIRQIECPITHKMIPEDRFDRHLQVVLSDPHYKTERENYKAKHKLSNINSDGAFENIKRLAKNMAGL